MMSHFEIGDVWAILFFWKMSKGSCFDSQTWLITDTSGYSHAFPMTSRCAVTGNKCNVHEQQGIKAEEIQGTRFANTKLWLLCGMGHSWVITAELKCKMPVDCHTIHMFSINIYGWDSKNMLQNCTVGERGKLIIAFWFEMRATLNMTVQLLIWHSLALLICFTTRLRLVCQIPAWPLGTVASGVPGFHAPCPTHLTPAHGMCRGCANSLSCLLPLPTIHLQPLSPSASQVSPCLPVTSLQCTSKI